MPQVHLPRVSLAPRPLALLVLAMMAFVPAAFATDSYSTGLDQARMLPRSYDHILMEHGPASVHVSTNEITGSVTVRADGVAYAGSKDTLKIDAARLQSVKPGSGSRLTLTYSDGSASKKLTFADTRPTVGSSSNGYRSDRIMFLMASIQTVIDSKNSARK